MYFGKIRRIGRPGRRFGRESAYGPWQDIECGRTAGQQAEQHNGRQRTSEAAPAGTVGMLQRKMPRPSVLRFELHSRHHQQAPHSILWGLPLHHQTAETQ
jgi:hypothetical protein